MAWKLSKTRLGNSRNKITNNTDESHINSAEQRFNLVHDRKQEGDIMGD